ncbi:MAG TPA: vWA domain-containing protein [Methylophilaceae bacterium]|nr:vWA domain-containing protein [Methylophilaceae bacterium]
MSKLLRIARENYESLLLALIVLMLALALLKPDIQLKQEVNSYLLLADVSQSMNAEDVKIAGKTVNRMEYTKHLMKRVVETSSCGTYISLGVFAGENVALLFMPLEVCANYDVITDSIDHLEWRMAWRGNSRLSFGVKSAESIFDYLNAPVQMIFFTDGDEAPKVNAINKLNLDSVQIGKNLLFVGVGGHEPVPIPRYNSRNKLVGFWSTDSKDNSPGAVGVTYSDTSKDEPDPMVAYAEYDRYLSQLDSEYLKAIAQETKASYIEGQDAPAFYEHIHGLEPAGSFITAYSIRWIYLSLALVFLVLTYLPDLMRRASALGRFKPAATGE